ncbi:Sec-independent protein translocase protein TatB [Georgfuchsia toluolica]|uniref:Sec-independent protein translocase protein TatB n=1 Tax=Georgfuchsia toluolica TaxID=424218 RepID=A0A916J4R5_9PROT|nr:Sec-independent protein translocase protein TatB [Georgfuchsia toluolica]CAG4883951.1 Sec-independent protein translocase protein TatB [Georgfuchsia toluolica]
MFDIGFSEMVVIAVVALIVLGPERLPGVARTVGALLGRMQRYFNDVKSEVNRELQLEDLRKMQQDLADKARAMEQSVRGELSDVGQTIEVAQEALSAPKEPSLESIDPALPGKAAANVESDHDA